ncbi:MAG: hypothetical protein OEL76_02390 [Siculibacillus sp.]|nr:hypothetical protein [Siculibacillus sp.]
MNRISMICAAAVTVLAATTPASAGGSSVMKKPDGSSVRIICNPTACQITFFDKSGAKQKMESADGGDYGFAVATQKYRGLGYN